MAHQVRPYPGIAPLLQALRGRIPMAVFTGASSQAAHLLLQATGLLDAFAAVVTGDEVARQKPHPDGIVRACALLGVAPQAAAYVCDAPTDLEAARRAGALAVAADWATSTGRPGWPRLS